MDDDANMSILGNTLTNGSDMWQELQDRRNGIKKEQEAATNPQPVKDYSQDIESLRSQVAETNRLNGELRGQLGQMEKQSSSMQQWLQQSLQQQQQQRAPEVEQLPNLEFEDPTLAAAMNAIDQRNEKRHQQLAQQTQNHINQLAYSNEAQKINDALARVRSDRPDFAKVVNDDQIREFVKPFLSPQYYGKMNWENEFRLIARTAEHPILESENAELKKKLAHYEKQDQRTKKEQKENLTKVPAIGQKSSGEYGSTSTSIGDRILDRHRKSHGKRSLPSWSDFGTELFSEISKGQ